MKDVVIGIAVGGLAGGGYTAMTYAGVNPLLALGGGVVIILALLTMPTWFDSEVDGRERE